MYVILVLPPKNVDFLLCDQGESMGYQQPTQRNRARVHYTHTQTTDNYFTNMCAHTSACMETKHDRQG